MEPEIQHYLKRFTPKGASMSRSPFLLQNTFNPSIYRQYCKNKDMQKHVLNDQLAQYYRQSIGSIDYSSTSETSGSCTSLHGQERIKRKMFTRTSINFLSPKASEIPGRFVTAKFRKSIMRGSEKYTLRQNLEKMISIQKRKLEMVKIGKN